MPVKGLPEALVQLLSPGCRCNSTWYSAMPLSSETASQHSMVLEMQPRSTPFTGLSCLGAEGALLSPLGAEDSPLLVLSSPPDSA